MLLSDVEFYDYLNAKKWQKQHKQSYKSNKKQQNAVFFLKKLKVWRNDRKI